MQVISTASPSPGNDPKSVNASYSRISEAFRHVTAGPLQCQVFCGGKSCKYERSDAWSSQQMAIPGLFSHWVTDTILAMARPNYTEMKKNNMIESFLKEKVYTIINLQETGEHASCGNALHSSGFSYDPIEFMNNGIFYYNFNIQDYSVPLQRTLLDICKVVTFAQSEGRVGIHCHAGLGRTGVVIACFLVYHHKMKPKDAVLLVRKNRPRSIQTRNQLKAVFRFANFLTPLWVQFPTAVSTFPCYTLEEIVDNQKIVLHGNEGKILKYIPKVLYIVCSLVLKEVGQDAGILYKKIHAKASINRPVTCPSSYELGIGEDLDSLAGSDTEQTALISENEVDEIAAQMTQSSLVRSRSAESLQSRAKVTARRKSANVVDTKISCLSQRLNLSPRRSVDQISFFTVTEYSGYSQHTHRRSQPALQKEGSVQNTAAETSPSPERNPDTDYQHANDHGTVAQISGGINVNPEISGGINVNPEISGGINVNPEICPVDEVLENGDNSDDYRIPVTTAIELDKAGIKNEEQEDANEFEAQNLVVKNIFGNENQIQDAAENNDEFKLYEDENEAKAKPILLLNSVTDEPRTFVVDFISGLSGKEAPEIEKNAEGNPSFDIDLVISQINSGIWESVSSVAPYQLGCLLRKWFTGLPAPFLTLHTVDFLLRREGSTRLAAGDESGESGATSSSGVITSSFKDKVAVAFETLSPAKVATIHCLMSTMAVLVYAPFKLKHDELLTVTQLLLTQRDNAEEMRRLSPVLSALLLSKHDEILRGCQTLWP